MKRSTKTVEPRLNLKDSIRKLRCERDHLYFTRYFFKQRQSINFRVNWHHHWIADVVQGIIDGTIKNVCINISPGSSKTEEVVINLIARGLALNPRARFLHLTYAEELGLKNSKDARDLVQSEEFQQFWPNEIAEDSKAKARWNVMVDGKEAGGVYASTLAGRVTGFRAGHMTEGFQGAIIIDDPMKPEDAYSEPKTKAANRRLVSTVKSRRANPATPVVMIMQRIAERDPTAFVMQGALGGDWTHIVIPAIIDDYYVDNIVPEKYRAMVDRSDRDEKGRFSYWPYKEPITDLVKMEQGLGMDTEGERMNRHVFTSQYMQSPKAIGGNIIRGAWFERYTILPKIKYRRIYADTAQKTKERNDYSVFSCYGLGENGKLYLLDHIRGKWEAPELRQRALAFWAKNNTTDPHYDWAIPPPQTERWAGQLRKLLVEDKASGTGLIQEIRLKGGIPVEGIERNKDKLTRAMDAQGYLEAGLVCVPENASFTSDFIEEAEAFTADDTHAFDDQLDPLFDAVQDMLSSKNKLEVWSKLI